MREGLTTAGELVGCSAATYGCFAFSRPLGFVVGGALLAFFSWLVDR